MHFDGILFDKDGTLLISIRHGVTGHRMQSNIFVEIIQQRKSWLQKH